MARTANQRPRSSLLTARRTSASNVGESGSCEYCGVLSGQAAAIRRRVSVQVEVSRLAGDHKLNLLCRPFGAETANGCLVLNRRGTTAERHERELKHLRILYTRFSEARRESICPLDTDLSWTSANLTLGLLPACPSFGNNRPAAGKILQSQIRLEHCLLTEGGCRLSVS
jgi:hypothetical protein